MEDKAFAHHNFEAVNTYFDVLSAYGLS